MLKSYYRLNQLEAGCDEAGRGCLAGPVFAAAVILPANYSNEMIMDSKKISEKQRTKVKEIIEKDAIAFSVAKIDVEEIDTINILQASVKAMNLAVNKLKIKPDFLLIDGNYFHTSSKIPFVCIKKGDATYLSIAAASVLAKVYRDDYMLALQKKYPIYQWHKNKGYPTKQHRESIIYHGVTKHHRKSFHLHSKQLNLYLE
ncbi:MAG: ribonuclease HII [Bacteroidales bacterium]|nr:ribonuclease HII [Bacteroidales bacterium]